MSKRAVLYARVSTESQADEDKTSLRQQITALRQYAQAEGYEIVQEVQGWEPNDTIDGEDRPHLNQVWELVQSGGVDLVLAQDADRIVRDPGLRAYLDEDFAAHGATFRALDDWGDDSMEGQLLKYVKGWAAKGEKLRFAERSRRNKVQKAQEGNIVPAKHPPYGYSYDRENRRLVLDEDRMAHVRRMFRMVGAEGQSMHSVKKAFERSGIPSPGGGQYWHVTTIRRMIAEQDAYRSHSSQEARDLVPPAVAAGLDPESRYGIYWYNKGRVQKKGKRRIIHPDKAPEHWIANVVPDSGIPREWVDAARERVAGNVRTSNAGRRVWELKGLLYCPCGVRMTAFDNHSRNPERRFYYVCSRHRRDGKGSCPYYRYWPAGDLEREVKWFVIDLIQDPDVYREKIRDQIEGERKTLRDPQEESRSLHQRLEQLEAERKGYLRLAAQDRMSDAELDSTLAELEDQRTTLRSELSNVDERRKRLAELEDGLEELYTIILAHPDKDPYVMVNWEEDADGGDPNGYKRLLQKLRLKAVKHPDGTLEVTGDYAPADGNLSHSGW